MTGLPSFRRGFHPVSRAGGAGPASQHWMPGAKFRLLSARIRRAFAAAPVDEAGGDHPPSDCWPSEVVAGQVRFHVRVDDSSRPKLSPGKFAPLTADHVALLTADHVALHRIGGRS
jgi:hypothetical protein